MHLLICGRLLSVDKIDKHVQFERTFEHGSKKGQIHEPAGQCWPVQQGQEAAKSNSRSCPKRAKSEFQRQISSQLFTHLDIDE
jgi:hypothetical protein